MSNLSDNVNNVNLYYIIGLEYTSNPHVLLLIYNDTTVGFIIRGLSHELKSALKKALSWTIYIENISIYTPQNGPSKRFFSPDIRPYVFSCTTSTTDLYG